MWARLGTAAAFVAAMAIAGPAAAAAPARLAFTSDRGVFTMNADGSDRTQLTPRGGAPLEQILARTSDFGPRWTPDGSAIVFSRGLVHPDDDGFEEYSVGRVLAMRPDGSGKHQLLPRGPRDFDDYFAGFLPNGQVLIERSLPKSSALFAVDVDGSHRHEITGTLRDTLLVNNDFTFSPDGKQILYTKYRLDKDYNYRPDLYEARADGTGGHRVVRDAGYARYSPDGSRIAVMSTRDSNGLTQCVDECEIAGEIYVMDPDGGHPRRLTFSGNPDENPSWSPDGRRITFQSDRNYGGGQMEIYSVRPAGGCLTWLTNGSAVAENPDWSPAGGDTDPAGCGGAGRPALVEVDLSALAHKPFPSYWFGERPPDGLILSRLQQGGGYAEIGWGDCAFFDPHRCHGYLDLVNYAACWQAGNLLLRGVPRHLSLRRGALVTNPTPFYGDFPSVYTGRAVIWLRSGLRHFGQLRRWPDKTPPAKGEPLPAAAFPKWFWHKLREVEESYARTHDESETAHEVGIERKAVHRRRGLARRLRQLGVHDVLPHCPKPPGLR